VVIGGENYIDGGAMVTSGTGVISATGPFVQLRGSGPGIVNSGSLHVASGTTLQTHGVVNNAGTIVLEDGSSAQLTGTVNNGGSISGAGLIQAGGNLSFNNGKLGVIDGSEATSALVIFAPMTNSGTLKGTGSAGLTITVSAVKNTSAATIEADSGSRVDLVLGATIIGGKLQTIATGRIHVTGATLDGGPSQVATNTMISNLGILSIDDHGVLDLKGTINNTGEIALQGADDVLPGIAPETQLVVVPSGAALPKVTLQGHGQIALTNNSHNLITGGSISLSNPTPITLINVDNTITGAGTIGGNGLVLNNKVGGEIDATGSIPLFIDTGSNAVTNAGILGSTASCTLFIASALNNTGKLNTNGGTIDVEGAVTGTGLATISSSGQVEFAAASSNGVKFAAGSTGELVLDDSKQYKGTISGFGANTTQAIDLADIAFASVTKSYAPASPNTAGTLTIKDGLGDVAHIKFSGTYTLANFKLFDDGNGGTLIKDPPVSNHAVNEQSGLSKIISLLGSFIASFEPTNPQNSGVATSWIDSHNAPLLVAPHV
jgi:hypothetical protein